MKRITLFSVLLLWGSIAFSQEKLSDKDMKVLLSRMTGSFSSEEQSKQDSSYFHIILHMKQVWTSKTDGFWLYVEQAVAAARNKPYRQRIYHVYKQDDTTFVSKVYEMKNPSQYIGAWEDESKLQSLSTDSLIDRQGCAIYLHKNKDGNFYGSTPGKECLSSLRGATYATSEAVIYADRLETWDRGWNKEDKQVWGAVKGGYIFKKESQ